MAPPGAQRLRACACSARKSSASSPAARRSKTPSTKRCATGSPTFALRTISSARVLGAHPVPDDGPRFSIASSAAKPANKFSPQKSACPTHLYACVGGGSNAIGLFYAFLRDTDVKMVGIEAGGRGKELGEHAARLGAPQGFTARARRSARHLHLRPAKRRRPDRRHALRSPPASTIPPSAPNTPGSHDERRAEYSAVSDDDAIAAAQPARPHRRHHPRARIRPRHRRFNPARPQNVPRRSRHPQPLRPRRQRHGHLQPPPQVTPPIFVVIHGAIVILSLKDAKDLSCNGQQALQRGAWYD